MKQELIRNLLTTANITIKETQEQINLKHEFIAYSKIGVLETLIKILKMVTCNHSEACTGVMYQSEYADIYHRDKLSSIREVTKRCRKCNLVIYRKTYNLMKKKGQRVRKIK